MLVIKLIKGFITKKKLRELFFGKDIYQVERQPNEAKYDYSEQMNGYHKPQGFDSDGRPLGFGLGKMRYTDDDSKLTPEYKNYRDKIIDEANRRIKIKSHKKNPNMSTFEHQVYTYKKNWCHFKLWWSGMELYDGSFPAFLHPEPVESSLDAVNYPTTEFLRKNNAEVILKNRRFAKVELQNAKRKLADLIHELVVAKFGKSKFQYFLSVNPVNQVFTWWRIKSLNKEIEIRQNSYDYFSSLEREFVRNELGEEILLDDFGSKRYVPYVFNLRLMQKKKNWIFVCKFVHKPFKLMLYYIILAWSPWFFFRQWVRLCHFYAETIFDYHWMGNVYHIFWFFGYMVIMHIAIDWDRYKDYYTKKKLAYIKYKKDRNLPVNEKHISWIINVTFNLLISIPGMLFFLWTKFDPLAFAFIIPGYHVFLLLLPDTYMNYVLVIYWYRNTIILFKTGNLREFLFKSTHFTRIYSDVTDELIGIRSDIRDTIEQEIKDMKEFKEDLKAAKKSIKNFFFFWKK